MFEKLCKFASFQICSKLTWRVFCRLASALSAEHLLLNPYVNIGHPYITIRPTHKKLFSFPRLTRMILKMLAQAGSWSLFEVRDSPQTSIVFLTHISGAIRILKPGMTTSLCASTWNCFRCWDFVRSVCIEMRSITNYNIYCDFHAPKTSKN